jgi:cobalt-zinc-cadmium efflux system membrane fusion protein
MPADLGQRVARGDPILWIESAELGRLHEAYIRSLSELRAASRSYERAKKLAEAKAISTGELQSREAGYLSIVAGVEAGERSLLLFGEDHSEIQRLRSQVEAGSSPSVQGPPRIAVRAPFEGRVLDRRVTPGTLVEAMQPLATLADLTKVWIFLQVYEKDLAQIRSGLAVRIRAEAYPDDTFPGAVDFVGGVVDEASRTIRVRATVPNPSEKLRPGMFVKAQVLVPNPKEEGRTVLVVPQGALQTLEGRPHVFVEAAPGRFVRRVVETGHTFEGFTEILAGVRAGEKVVTEGSFVLKSEFARAELAEEH